MRNRNRDSGKYEEVAVGVYIYRRWNRWWVYSLRLTPSKQALRTSDREEAVRRAKQRTSAGITGLLESLEQALDRYMTEYSTIHHRIPTGKHYKQVITLFIKDVGRRRPPSEVTRKHVLDFQRKRKAQCAPDTVNGDMGYIKAFLNWCRAEGLLDHDPCFKVRRLKVNRRRRRTLTADEFREIQDALADVPFLHDYILVAANTGMRPGEILHVRGCDYDSKGHLLHITAWGDWQTKDAEDRTLSLNATAREILARRKLKNGNDSLPLFHGLRGVVRSRNNVYREMKKLLPEHLSWVRLYEFRHHFATEAVRLKWRAEDLQIYMGHADIRTTLNYYIHVTAEQLGAPPVIARKRRPS